MNESGYVIFELLIALLIMGLFVGAASMNLGTLKEVLDLRLSQWQLGSDLNKARQHSKSNFTDTLVTEYPSLVDTQSSNPFGSGFTPYGHTKYPTTLQLNNGVFIKKIVVSSGYGQIRFE
jgi:hypothetical protein